MGLGETLALLQYSNMRIDNAETKEVLAGFYLIDAADLNEAMASEIPSARRLRQPRR
jgi:hypothetical protein